MHFFAPGGAIHTEHRLLKSPEAVDQEVLIKTGKDFLKKTK